MQHPNAILAIIFRDQIEGEADVPGLTSPQCQTSTGVGLSLAKRARTKRTYASGRASKTTTPFPSLIQREFRTETKVVELVLEVIDFSER